MNDWAMGLGVALLSATMRAMAAEEPAETIYRGGDMLTMADNRPSVEAIAVRAGLIVAAGTEAEVLPFRGPTTRMVDLQGKTLLPGFIDAHSHIAQYEQTWGLPNLSPPPVGDVRSIADIVARMKAFMADQRIPPGELVLGHGYDDSLLEDRRHPTRVELDRVSTEHPVMLVHASGHLVAVNSAALKKVGYDRSTKDPQGGTIRRDAQGEPNGVCEELAGMPFLALMKPNSIDRQVSNLVEIQEFYARHGITTAQDGISMVQNLRLLREAAARGKLILDIVAYPRWDQFNDVLAGTRKLDVEYHPPMFGCCGFDDHTGAAAPAPDFRDDAPVKVGVYQHHFKIGGIKITGDGSPQGKTAFLTKPYVRPPAGMPADYRGYPTVTQDELDRWFDAAWTHNVQLLVHCNGDAAADMMIAAVRKARDRHGPKDLRPVMIHAQMIRHEQVDEMAALGIVPSFFTAHTFYWGDWHVAETVGRERAFGMSPAAYAVSKGLRFTNHSDAPVVPPDALTVVWTAVNRMSRSGAVIGPDERISPLDALKAVTIHAAWQYFEEKSKGSLEVGKRADLVILDRNPLKVDPRAIKDIRVVETIKDGQTIFPSTAR